MRMRLLPEPLLHGGLLYAVAHLHLQRGISEGERALHPPHLHVTKQRFHKTCIRSLIINQKQKIISCDHNARMRDYMRMHCVPVMSYVRAVAHCMCVHACVRVRVLKEKLTLKRSLQVDSRDIEILGVKESHSLHLMKQTT